MLAGFAMQRRKGEIVEHGGAAEGMLRTTPLESELLLISWLSSAERIHPCCGSDSKGLPSRPHSGKRLPHFIVQFARDQPSLLFLRLRRRADSRFNSARCGSSPCSVVRLCLQLQMFRVLKIASTNPKRHRQADRDVRRLRNWRNATGPQLSGIQLRFVDGRSGRQSRASSSTGDTHRAEMHIPAPCLCSPSSRRWVEDAQ